MARMKRFFDVYIPSECCNFKCSYCYIGQRGGSSESIIPIGHTPEEIGKALSVNRLGGVCFFNFCAGGETLLGEDLLPVIKRILQEGHYIQIVTNGTITKRFEEIVSWDAELTERMFFKFSFHYEELKRLNLFDVYFKNIQRVKEAGCSFTVELVPYDELAEYIDDIKDLCIKNTGALPHVTVGRDEGTKELALLSKHSKSEYKKIWSVFDSEMFNFKVEMFGEAPNAYCYAGEWSCSLRLDTGDVIQCNGCRKIDNIYENTDRPLKYQPVGMQCPHAHCYNCHAYITMGAIPGFDAPTYVQMRDRECADGSHWITPKVRDFFNQKFEDNNITYACKKNKYKVLLVGDSIREGYGKYVQEELKNLIDVVQIPENARFSGYTLRMLHNWANTLQIGSDIDLIYWNNGLWDVVRLYGDEPLTSVQEYERTLNRIIKRMHHLFPNAKIVFATTTPILEEQNENIMFVRRNCEIEEYNEVAVKVMEKQGIPVDDLYSVALDTLNSMHADWTHFSEEGNAYLGHHVASSIFNILENKVHNAQEELYTLENIQRFKEYKIAIYGYGNYGKKIKAELDSLQIPIVAICDSQKHGQTVDGREIISVEALCAFGKTNKDILVIIAIDNLNVYREVRDMIQKETQAEVCHYSIVSRIDHNWR